MGVREDTGGGVGSRVEGPKAYPVGPTSDGRPRTRIPGTVGSGLEARDAHTIPPDKVSERFRDATPPGHLKDSLTDLLGTSDFRPPGRTTATPRPEGTRRGTNEEELVE